MFWISSVIAETFYAVGLVWGLILKYFKHVGFHINILRLLQMDALLSEAFNLRTECSAAMRFTKPQ